MIVAHETPQLGRPQLDRDQPFHSWTNEPTKETFKRVAKEASAKVSDALEATARLIERDPVLYAALQREIEVVRLNNLKYPPAKPEAPLPDEGKAPETPLLAEPYEVLDPYLKEATTPEDFEAIIESTPVQTLEDLERLEDQGIEDLYESRKNHAMELAITKPGDFITGRKPEYSQARYALELKEARQKKEKHDAARAAFRAKRRAQMLALLTPALRLPGNPRLQRQYHDQEWREATGTRRGSSAFETAGGVTRRDLDRAEDALKTDSS